MDIPPDSSGQRLRWWQDTAPKSADKWYSESAPPVTQPLPSQLAIPEPLELADELEAEALRRAALAQDAVLIEGSYAQSLPRTRRMFAWVVGIAFLLYPALAIVTHAWFLALVPLIFIAEYFILTSLMRKKFGKHKSQVVISSLGITVEMPYYRIGPVFWDEIESVRTVNWFFTRFVRIKLKNPKKTHQRALTVKPGAMSAIARWSLNMTHIEIVDQWFAESAQEMTEKIATFLPASEKAKG